MILPIVLYGASVLREVAEPISPDYPELQTTVDADEYDELIDFALDIGVENSFMQEGGAASESFIPTWDCTGV